MHEDGVYEGTNSSNLFLYIEFMQLLMVKDSLLNFFYVYFFLFFYANTTKLSNKLFLNEEATKGFPWTYCELSHKVIQINLNLLPNLVHWPGKRWDCGRLPLLSQGPN